MCYLQNSIISGERWSEPPIFIPYVKAYTLESSCHYSYLNDSTGLLEAALKDCQKIVIKATPMEMIPDKAKIHHDNSVLYAK
jgi:hypothetical protein